MAANSQNEDIASEEAREIIDPPSMKNFVRKTPGGDALDMSVVTRAENALERISAESPKWMKQELEALRGIRDDIRANGLTDKNTRWLFLHLHNFKGQAATLGFPLVGKVAGSLCDAILTVPAGNIPNEIFENHLDAIFAIASEDARGDGNEVARKLVTRLRDVTQEYLDHMAAKSI